MSLDLTLDLPCEPKRTLGYADADAGTRVLINLLTMKTIGGTIRQLANAEGRDLTNVRTRLTIVRPEREAETRELTIAEIDSETAGLNPLAELCRSCPASAGGVAFGCVRQIQYPIGRTAEEWIRDRLPQAGTFAAFLMQNAVLDFQYDGSAVEHYRTEGLLELAEGLKSASDPALGTDAFFHALLGVGPKLEPWHLAMLLTWLNALGLDGKYLRTPDEFDTLTQMPIPERAGRVSVAIGAAHTDDGVKAMQRLLFAMASAWMIGVSLRVDS